MSTQKRVFIIHGWGGYPEEGCFPQLKKELEAKGFIVKNPAMPNSLRPEIETWVNYLKEQIGAPDENVILFGHSIGVQTILRYLESLPKGVKIAGAVFLAGWMHLTEVTYEEEGDREIAKPWLETPINVEKIKQHVKKFIAIFSDDDGFIPIENRAMFEERLGAKTIVEHQRGHFKGSDGIKELPSALSAVLEIAGEKK